MDLRQMEFVVTLADEQQFTRAAALAGVSQSGLSASIRALEDELGTPLFSRTTRKVEPTEAGLALLPFARAMLSQAAAGRDAVIRATHALSGTLRVGAEQCLNVLDVPALLERFHTRYPGVTIEFTQGGSHELLKGVRGGRLDVAFVATTEHLGSLERTPIAREPIVLLCPPDHEFAGRAKLDWEELSDRDFIEFNKSWGVRGVNDASCDANGVRRRIRCTVDDIHLMLDFVHRGMGLVMVPLPVAAKPQATGLVTVKLPSNGARDWEVSAVSAQPLGSGAASPAPQLLELLR
jgi:DNA-binding transcriptional LysR family regulator